MKNIVTAALVLVAFGGCVNQRFVTARTWMGTDRLYVAYTEYEKKFLSESFEAKVLRCDRASNNQLQCNEEQQLNQVLNEGSSTAK